MTEKSLFWFTDGFTGDVGDGAAPYTQEEYRLFNHGWLANDRPNVGVFPAVLNELEVTGATSPLSMNTGRASVYGFPYWADAAVSLSVTTPVVGTTGGLVVLRAIWSGGGEQTVRAFVLLSDDGVASIPGKTQDAGITWDTPVFSFTITTGGAITLTDVRRWIAPLADDSTIEVGADGKLKTSDLIAEFPKRQGGSATDFSVAGTTNYVPGDTKIQFGTINSGNISDGGAASILITFPDAFSAKPIVLASMEDVGLPGGVNVDVWVVNPATNNVSVKIYNNTGLGGTINVDIYWQAIGPA